MFFTERLALLLDTGNPLHAALKIIEQQAENPLLANLIKQLRQDIAGGLSFSQALANHPRVFSTTYVNLIAAGEQGGFIAEVLQRLIELEEKQAELRSTLTSAFSYPCFLILFSVGVVLFVLMVVFPKFTELFSRIADQLPFTTTVLMAVSDILRQYWYLIIAGLGTSLFSIARWLSTPSGVATVDRFKLKVPVIKDIFIKLYLSQMMRVTSLSLANGVSVPDTLKACRDVVRNSVFRDFVGKVEAHVNEGQGIAIGFQQTAFMPTLVRQMVATGEETGNLPVVMGRIADFYERELMKRLTTLSKMVEPFMLLFMGAVVGLIVSSLILPIFKLSRAVG